MTVWRANSAVVLAIIGVVSACSVVTDLGGLSDRPDASVTDAAVNDASATDATGTDAVADVIDAATVDVIQGDGGTCSGQALVGYPTTDFTSLDTVALSTADAYGYLATSNGTARCAWVYLELFDGGAGAQVQLAVYTHDGVSAPKTRMAVATIPSPKTGWNAAALDKAVPITAGETWWIGVLDTGAPVGDRAKNPCSASPLNVQSRAGISVFPDPFGGNPGGSACSAALYLTP